MEGVKLDFAQEPPLSQRARSGPLFGVAQQKEPGEQVAKMLEKGAIEKVGLPGSMLICSYVPRRTVQ